MKLDQDMETMCDEACRCLDGLVDSDDSFDTYFPSYCIEHCPDWPLTKREELVFAVHMLAIIEVHEILHTAKWGSATGERKQRPTSRRSLINRPLPRHAVSMSLLYTLAAR